MKRIFLIVLLLVCLSYAFSSTAKDDPDYFPTGTEQERRQAMAELGVRNCEELLAEYFDLEKDDPKIIVQASIYDIGLCVERDLAKAAALYEHGYNTVPKALPSTVRLALIYGFGPSELRNLQKSDFFMKQSAITVSVLPDKDMRKRNIDGMFLFQNIPENFKQHLRWADSIRSKSNEERKGIALNLQQQGYKYTYPIWNEFEK